MKVRFYRWYNALLASLLTLLGYGCSVEDPMDEYGVIPMYGAIAEYGVPTVRYCVKGIVTDEDGNPIKNIKASMKEEYSDERGSIYFPLDSTMTDAHGQFTIDNLRDGYLGHHKLILEDIDGEENGGEFQSDTLSLNDLEAKQIEPSNGTWDQGKYELTGTFRLKKKEQ